MKKIFFTLLIFLTMQVSCYSEEGISFIYINGSNNNDVKMKNWYENGVRKLHPVLKNEFEQSQLAKKYFLKDGQFFIEELPTIFFWGDMSHNDLKFVENNLAIMKANSPWVAYQVRKAITHFLHDAIWVQKYHNMKPLLDNLHKTIKAKHNEDTKSVILGYSAGSFVTYEYILTRLPYINVFDFFNKVGISSDEMKFVEQHPMKNTCMEALGGAKIAVISASGHIIPNTNPELFKTNYLNLDEVTEDVCAAEGSVKGIINFASPLVLFYSDIADSNFELTYYNKLLYKYIIEKDLFWLTVNFKEDPLGFPTAKNLTIEELENYAQINIEPHKGFIYDWSNSSSRRTFLGAHTAYWSAKKNFSSAIVEAYDNGYRHQYDKEFQKRALKDYAKKIPLPKIPAPEMIRPYLQKMP